MDHAISQVLHAWHFYLQNWVILLVNVSKDAIRGVAGYCLTSILTSTIHRDLWMSQFEFFTVIVHSGIWTLYHLMSLSWSFGSFALPNRWWWWKRCRQRRTPHQLSLGVPHLSKISPHHLPRCRWDNMTGCWSRSEGVPDISPAQKWFCVSSEMRWCGWGFMLSIMLHR